MRIEDAYYKMAELRIKIINFRKECGEKSPSSNISLYKIGDDFKNLPPLSPSPSPEIVKQFNFLEADLKSFGKQLASYSYIYPLLKCWMIDVRGIQGEGGEEAMKEFLEDKDGTKLIEKQGGIATIIQTFVTKEGFNITDRGAGCGNWQIGSLCNSQESDRLCGLLHMEFRNLIKKEIIAIYKIFWGYELPGLITDNDVKKWWQENE